MPITYSGRGVSPTKNTAALTVNGVVVGGLLVAQVIAWKYGAGAGNIVSGVSSGGVQWTLARRDSYVKSGSNHTTETSIWFRMNAPAGNTTATVAFGPTPDDYVWMWREWRDAATSGALDKAGGGSSLDVTSVTASATGALALADSLVIGVMAAPYGGVFTRPGGSDLIADVTGNTDPTPINGQFVSDLPNSTSSLTWSWGISFPGGQGSLCSVATFRGGTTQKRIEINNCDTAINGTTGWTVRHWVTDGATFSGARVENITAEATGGRIFVTGSTVPNLADGTAINCVCNRPGASPPRGLVGVVQGVVKDFT